MSNPHFDRALVLLEQSRPELAEQELRLALANDPDNAAMHALLSLCLSDRDSYTEATSEAQQAIHLDPESDLAHYALARAFLGRNRPEEALPAIHEALRLDPQNADYYALLAQAHLEKRRWQEALAAAEQGLRVNAEHVSCNNLRAMALVSLGRKQEAGQTIAAALARDPDDPFTHANQGWTLLEQGAPRQAMEHFREALRLDPNLEWARLGIIEAMKAQHFVYRFMLGYFLWMRKLDPNVQWVIIVGALFVPRLLRGLVSAAPILEPLYWPLYFAYMLFVVMTWVADPLFNLVLRLNRFGRLVLSREQIIESNLLGLCLFTAVAMAVGGLIAGSGPALLCGIFLVLVCLPLSAIYRCDPGWPRVLLSVVTLFLAIAAFSVLLPKDQRPQLFNSILSAFPLYALGSQFLAIVLSRHRAKH